MKGLTKRQREVLDFIQDYVETHQFSPSYREIMKHFGFSSIASVSKHLSVLQRKGAIAAEKNSRRSIIPIDQEKDQIEPSEVQLPFIGHVMAGAPIETFPRTQNLSVPKFLVNQPDNTYVLRARGESLNKEMIADGDLILVEARSDALASESIIGTVDGNRTFIKKYYPEGNSVRLTSHSLEEVNIKSEDLVIHGVVVGLWRLFN